MGLGSQCLILGLVDNDLIPGRSPYWLMAYLEHCGTDCQLCLLRVFL